MANFVQTFGFHVIGNPELKVMNDLLEQQHLNVTRINSANLELDKSGRLVGVQMHALNQEGKQLNATFKNVDGVWEQVKVTLSGVNDEVKTAIQLAKEQNRQIREQIKEKEHLNQIMKKEAEAYMAGIDAEDKAIARRRKGQAELKNHLQQIREFEEKVKSVGGENLAQIINSKFGVQLPWLTDMSRFSPEDLQKAKEYFSGYVEAMKKAEMEEEKSNQKLAQLRKKLTENTFRERQQLAKQSEEITKTGLKHREIEEKAIRRTQQTVTKEIQARQELQRFQQYVTKYGGQNLVNEIGSAFGTPKGKQVDFSHFSDADLARAKMYFKEIVTQDQRAADEAVKINERKNKAIQGYRNSMVSSNAQSLNKQVQDHKEAGQKILVSWESIFRLIQVQILHRFFATTYRTMVQTMDEVSRYVLKIAEIQAISLKANDSTEKWSNAIRGLSDEFGNPIFDVVEATYETVSNQISKTASDMNFMREAAILAAVGVSRMTDAVNASSGVINAYGMNTNKARIVNAQLFKTVDLGRIRINEVGESMGRLSILAAQLGIPVEFVDTAIATLSIQGVEAKTSMTALSNVFLKMIRPTEAMNKLFKEWGVTSGKNLIETYGTIKAFQMLEEHARKGGDAVAELGELFGRMRAIVGATGILFKKELFDTNYAKIAFESMSDLTKAQELVMENSGKRLQIELNKVKNMFTVTFGDVFLQQMLKINDTFGGLSKITGVTVQTIIELGTAFIIYKTISYSVATVTALKTAFEEKYILALLREKAAVGICTAAMQKHILQQTIWNTALSIGSSLIIPGAILGLTHLAAALLLAEQRAKEAVQEVKALATQIAQTKYDQAIDALNKWSIHLRDTVEANFRVFHHFLAAFRLQNDKWTEHVVEQGRRAAKDLGEAFKKTLNNLDAEIKKLKSSAESLLDDAIKREQRFIEQARDIADNQLAVGNKSKTIEEQVAAIQKRIADYQKASDDDRREALAAMNHGEVELSKAKMRSVEDYVKREEKLRNDLAQRIERIRETNAAKAEKLEKEIQEKQVKRQEIVLKEGVKAHDKELKEKEKLEKQYASQIQRLQDDLTVSRGTRRKALERQLLELQRTQQKLQDIEDPETKQFLAGTQNKTKGELRKQIQEQAELLRIFTATSKEQVQVGVIEEKERRERIKTMQQRLVLLKELVKTAPAGGIKEQAAAPDILDKDEKKRQLQLRNIEAEIRMKQNQLNEAKKAVSNAGQLANKVDTQGIENQKKTLEAGKELAKIEKEEAQRRLAEVEDRKKQFEELEKLIERFKELKIVEIEARRREEEGSKTKKPITGVSSDEVEKSVEDQRKAIERQMILARVDIETRKKLTQGMLDYEKNLQKQAETEKRKKQMENAKIELDEAKENLDARIKEEETAKGEILKTRKEMYENMIADLKHFQQIAAYLFSAQENRSGVLTTYLDDLKKMSKFLNEINEGKRDPLNREFLDLQEKLVKQIYLRKGGSFVLEKGELGSEDLTLQKLIAAWDNYNNKIVEARKQQEEAKKKIGDLPKIIQDTEKAVKDNYKEHLDAGKAGVDAAGKIITVQEQLKRAIETVNKLLVEQKLLSADQAQPAPVQPHFGGRFAFGGGTDRIPALLSRGEYVWDALTAKTYAPLIRSLNLGPKSLAFGGNTTNIGDINVTVQGGNTSHETVRNIATQLRREMRRGTINLGNN